MNENKFSYVYRAPTAEERKEIDSIRKQYAEGEEESKMNRLRSLHARVKRSATAISLTVGIIGCLTFGVGLTTVLEWGKTLTGVIVATVGCLPMGFAYPLYKRTLERNKKKYGGEILRLSEELLAESK